jgi:uncharacterized delta-60 repeat protein
MFRSRWTKLFDRSRKTPAPRRRTLRPALEALEERTLLNGGGYLDPTFGQSGIQSTDFNSTGKAVAIDPTTGDIVVAGYAVAQNKQQFAVARYLPGGTLDTAGFNPNGGAGAGEVLTNFANTPIGFGNAQATTVAIDPANGDIVVAGFAQDVNPNDANYGAGANNDFAVVAYRRDGSLDPNFGKNGQVVFDFTTQFGGKAGDDRINALGIDGQGRIVVGGFATNPAGVQYLALARLDAFGNLDGSFGGKGLVTANINAAQNIGPGNDVINGLAIDGSDNIVAAGSAFDGNRGHYDFAVARYSAANGQLDGSFGNLGATVTPFAGANDGRASAAALGPDGQVVLAGTVSNAGGSFFELAQYRASGVLDAQGFGNGGTTATVINNTDSATAVAFDGDGNIVVAGTTVDPNLVPAGQNVFAVARYQPNGALDGSFADPQHSPLPGVVTTAFFKKGASASGLAIDPASGAIIVAGTATRTNGDASFGLAGYLASNGTVTLSGPASVPAGQAAVFTITRSVTAGPASVTVSTGGGTAVPGRDYTALSQVVNFAPGVASAQVTVQTLVDPAAAGQSRTVMLTLSNEQGVDPGTPSTATLTIQGPALQVEKVQLDKSSYSASAGATPTQVQVVVDRDSAVGTVDVPFTIPAGADYTVATQSPLVFLPGQTRATITLNIQPESAATSNGSVTVTLGAPTSPDNSASPSLGSPASATLTIQEPETVQMAQSGYSVAAGVSPTQVQVTVDRSAAAGTVQVPFTVTGGSGFTVATPGPLVFKPGDTQETITINIPAAAPGAGDQSLAVTLGTPTSADGSASPALGSSNTQATVTVLAPETFTVSGPGLVNHNGGSANYTVTRSGSTDGTATVQWSVSGSALSSGEYQGPSSGTLTLGPGVSQGTISLPISNSGQYVGDQSLNVTMTGVSLDAGTLNKASVGSPSSAGTTVHETNHRPIVAELVPVRMGRKPRFMVEVLYANDGTLKTEFLSPFQQPVFRNIQVSAVQGNGAGLPDQVLLTARKGRRSVSMEIPV